MRKKLILFLMLALLGSSSFLRADEVSYDFEGSLQGWTNIDGDGDGDVWVLGSTTMGSGYGHNGSSDLVLSKSYDNNFGALTPNNFLVSPAKAEYSQISFWACAQDNAWASEHFGVAVSTTNNTSASAFTTIQEWTMTAKGGGVPAPGRGGDLRTQGTWYQYTVDLSAYAGQEIWVAIRHFNCSDWFYLDVDDITLTTSGSTPVPPTPTNQWPAVIVGNLEGAGNNSYLPMNSLYNYSYTQQIYTAAEIGTSGVIDTLVMWMYGTADLPARTFDIYLKEVDKDAFASSTDWVTVAATDKVYSGTVAFNNTTAQPYAFILDTPFNYSGQHNLLVCFNNVTGTWKSGLNGKVFGASGDPVRAIYVRQDAAAYDPYNPTFTATNTTYQRNVLGLTFGGGSSPINPVPTGSLSVTPNPFEMGERPINAWVEPYTIRILNGGPNTHIEAVISDVSGVTPFIIAPEINMDIAYEEAVEAIISLNDTIADGDYAEEFTLYYPGDDKSMVQIPVTATVYTAVKPDVVELKQNINATNLPNFSYRINDVRANYNLQGMTEMKPDAVYYFNLTADSDFEVTLSNGGHIALYPYRSNFHPTSADEPVLMGEDHLETTLSMGKYYMIVAGDEINGSTISGSATTVPVPTALTYLAPENMAHDIVAPMELTWEGGEYATEYQVLFGTTYPPTQVIEDWTAIDEYYGAYPIAELNNSTQYFWQIKVRNNQGADYAVEEGPVWGFTTSLVPPTNVRLTETQIFTDGSTVIKWDNMGNGGGGFSGEFTVCDGTATNSYIPVYGLWMDYYTRGEMIYPAEMLEGMNGADITSMKFYISSAATGPWTGDMFHVYLAEVDATTFTTYYTAANAEIVYDGALDGQGSEMVINFDDAYHYEGGNLLVGIEEYVNGTWKSCSFYGVEANGASSSGYSSASLSAVTFNQRNFLPKTTFICGSKGYRDVANRSFRGYNVYLVNGAAGGSTGGAITVDFETGDFSQYTFNNTSTYPWTIVAPSTGNSSNYCMKSSNGGVASSTSEISATATFPMGGSIAFQAECMGEGTSSIWDKCIFQIDGNQQFSYGANIPGWNDYSFDVDAGEHTFTWKYTKDSSVNPTGDYMMVDNIVFTGAAGGRDDEPTAIKLNDQMLTENQYLFEPNNTDFYNMPNGSAIHVTAIYDEGESGYDNGFARLYISGYSSFYGTVTENLGGPAIANAEISFSGVDEFGNTVNYSATTDANGEYEIDQVAVGTYTAVAEADGFEVVILTGLTNEHLVPAEVNFEMHEVYYPVYRVYAEDMDNIMARVQWSLYDFEPTTGGGTGGGGGGTGGGTGSTFTEDFEGGAIPAGWATIDADGDGSNWVMASATMGTGYGHNASGDCILSKSYDNSLGALNPNNYLVTPQVDLAAGSTFTFYACAQDNAWASEHFGVAISTGSQTNAGDFTMLQEWTMTAKGGGVPAPGRGGDLRTQGNWYQYTVDLSNYAGQQAYIAIRHFNCSDWFYLDVDDVALTNGSKGGDRSVVFYNLYRKALLTQEPIAADDSINLTVEQITDTLYADFDWYNLEPGLYQYGVNANYPGWDLRGNRGGYIIDFETGDFSQFPQYTNSASYPWVVVDGAHSGKGMKSSNGGVASSASEISATVNYITDGTVSFWAECKGEGTSTIWDKCIFQIDGDEQFCYGANQAGWNEYNYDITAGEHTFTWKYTKDSSVNPTGDYMMVDDINFYYAGGGGGNNPITDVTWSNVLPKNMGNTVTVRATSTIGTVEGAQVHFMNTNPYDANFVFEGTFDETGEIVFEEFRRGEYMLTADLEGFTCEYDSPTAISIWEDNAEINIHFAEKFEPVPEMWVSSTGWARWTDILPEAGEIAERYIVNMNNVLQGETTNPYMQLNVDGLENGHTYTAKVAVIYSTGMSGWTSANFTYQECDGTNPVIDTIYNTEMDVTLTWDGGTPGPGPGPGPGPTPPTGNTFDFDDNTMMGWTSIDGDGDGNGWVSSANPGIYHNAGVSLAGTGHNASQAYVISGSYANQTGQALTPNNFLVSPAKAEYTGINFFACAQDANYAAEHYGVAVSTTGNTSASDFTIVAEWTLSAKDLGAVSVGRDGQTRTQGNWYEKTVDLSAYAGQEIWVAIRHFNCTDMFILNIDDITLGVPEKSAKADNCGMSLAATPSREMWDVLKTFNAAEGGQYGVVTDGQYIYTSNWGYSSAAHNFYKYDMDGNQIEGFEISGCGTLRGMTYDGEYIYGVANSSTVYIVDLNNHTLVGTFSSAYGAMRCISYDPQRDGFWVVGNWSGNLTLIDRTGAIQFQGPAPTSASDVAYYKDADGVEHVYCFNNADNGIYDYNVTTNTLGGSVFNYSSIPGFQSGASSGGCHIANYGDKLAFYGDIQQSPNLIAICELGAAQGGGGGSTASSYVANKYNLVVDGEVVASTSDNFITWTCPDYNEHLYQVVWVDANYNISCPDEVPYQIPLTEVSENTVANTTVYPNPTSGDLHINANGMIRISIVNTLGQVVYDQAVKCDETVVNMARFDAGIYMVNIVTSTGTNVKRVVVTK